MLQSQSEICDKVKLESLADVYATPAREVELIAISRKPPGSRPTSGKWVGGRASVLNILDVAVAQSEEEIEPDGLLDDDARLSIERYTSHRYRASALI